MSIIKRKILLTGKNGQVGWELQRTLVTLGEVVAVNHQQMDLSDPDSIRRVIREVKPNLIVNAAAYTAVDKAESESNLAMAINGIAPGLMAEEAKRLGAAIIHYSTDYVFDGTKTTPYSEDDTPHPVSVYGQTKLVGDKAIEKSGAAHIILRTTWIYGERGRNFLRTIVRLAGEQDELRIVNDQLGAPTWSRMIAEITAQMLAKSYGLQHGNSSTGSARLHSLPELSGIYNLTCTGETSWFGFASAILDRMNSDIKSARLLANGTNTGTNVGVTLPRIIPIPTSSYPLPARRPANSLLSTVKLQSTFGLRLTSWVESLDLCIDAIRL